MDPYNRSVGWALSVMAHRPGTHFGGGLWAFSGVREPGFYASNMFVRTLSAAMRGGQPASATASALWREQGQMRLRAAAAAAARPSRDDGFISIRDGHLTTPSGDRYFMLGGNYFRSAFLDADTPDLLRADLLNAVAAGLNTVRTYGNPDDPDPALIEVFRSIHALSGLRILWTTPCYKNTGQGSKAGVIEQSAASAQVLANESWLLGYDYCNEPDDQSSDGLPFPAYLTVEGSTTLADKYPAARKWGDFVKFMCDGWSTTFAPDKCRPLSTLKALPRQEADAFGNLSAALAEWIDWKSQGVRSNGGGTRTDNRALHASVPTSTAPTRDTRFAPNSARPAPPDHGRPQRAARSTPR